MGRDLYETSKKLRRKLWRVNVVAPRRAGFAWRTSCNFSVAILNAKFKPCLIICINKRHALERQSGPLSFLTYLGKDGIDLGQFSFPFLPWLIVLDNFACWCGRTLSFRLVELLLLEWKLQTNKEMKWHSKT